MAYKVSRKLRQVIRHLLNDFPAFTEQVPGFHLRSYQKQAAKSILDSILNKSGNSLVMMFPRQSGKNTLQAYLEVYLLWRFQFTVVEMVKISPTYQPQSNNARFRLQSVLEKHPLTYRHWRREAGGTFRFGQARIHFLSGSIHSNIVGMTASLLLQIDEAQDILPEKFDKEIAPMAAATNATRTFWGTAWNDQTLLARELCNSRLAEESDWLRRTFILKAEDIACEVPAYGDFVQTQIARLGRQHPLVKTQYFSEEIQTLDKLFSPARLALLQGEHAPQISPQAGHHYALLIDVGGGENENPEESSYKAMHDSSALTIIDVDVSGTGDSITGLPIYRVAFREEWIGEAHIRLYSHIKHLAEFWQAQHIVIDATGLGAGLASFLNTALPGKVLPFVFSTQSKSRLGWDFIGLIETGRFKEYCPAAENPKQTELHYRFLEQLRHIRHTLQAGRILHWGTPNGATNPVTGEVLHDDLVISAALCSLLDDFSWSNGQSIVIQPNNPGYLWDY